MNAGLVKHHRDINFTVVAKVESHHVEFTVYEINGFGINKSTGEFDVPLWRKKDADCNAETVDTLYESEPYLHGSVKWDGCSNWYFDEQDRVMLHACDRENLLAIGEIMARCWDWTKELLPNFDQ